uniref:Putative ovule protein n=1 Tax=Solanum chacoense TaxID=4108 RepID=A0A0V0H583_SOLCH
MCHKYIKCEPFHRLNSMYGLEDTRALSWNQQVVTRDYIIERQTSPAVLWSFHLSHFSIAFWVK